MSSFNGVGAAANSPAGAYLEKALSNGRFSHAYLFTGPSGTGKKMLANLAAQALLCEGKTDKPCGICLSCQTFVSKNHPDVCRIKPDKKTSVSAKYTRRAIVNDSIVKPFRSPYKVYIIEKADWMNTVSQNILLKTLEEPPAYAIFLLCAENEKFILPTVLSRCVRIRTTPLPIDQTADILQKERLGITRDEALFYAGLAGGSVGRALELSNPGKDDEAPLAIRVRDKLLTVLKDIPKASSAEILLRAKSLEVFRDEWELIFDIMAAWYRDLAVYNLRGEEGLINADIKKCVAAEAPVNDSACKMLDYIEDARRKLSANVGFQITIEVLMLKLGRKIT